MSFAKNIRRNISNKYGQKLLDSAKKSTTDAIKTSSKRTIQKPVEDRDDLIGNKIAEKVISFLKNSPTELHSKELRNSEMETPKKKKKKRYIAPEERQQIID